MKKIYLLLLMAFGYKFLHAQNNVGLPDIINYSKNDYAAGTQNWGIIQGPDNLMYFANNEGLLSYDGTYWKLHPLPNRTIVRSLALGNDGKIYVGGQDEIGFFAPDRQGRLQYHSLINLLPPNERSFADVWDVVIYKNSVFFRSTKKIIQYAGQQAIPYNASEWLFLGLVNDMLIAQDARKGLLQFQSGMWVPFPDQKKIPSGSIITSATAMNKDTILLTTLKHGCYLSANGSINKWQSPDIEQIAAQKIYSSADAGHGNFLLATSTGGCFIVDGAGNQLSSFSKKEGLQNNNILSVFTDKNKNIWLGLENGIDLIAYNNAIKHIYPTPDKEVSGFSSLVHQGKLYLGTSNGLYATTLNSAADITYSRSNFELIANSGGQVWNISEVNGTLLLGHHEGSFIIKENKALPLDEGRGYWTFLPAQNVLPSSLMVAGTYDGVGYYQFKDDKFQHLIDAPFESARFVLADGENIWVSHPYKGIFKVSRQNGFTAVVTRYNKQKGIASINNNYIFKIRNRIVVTTQTGVLEYNAKKDVFEPSAYFNNIFSNEAIRYLKEDKQGNIWFVFRKNLGVVDFSGSKPAVTYISELDNKLVAGFEHVYPLDAKNIIVGGEQGFYHINYEAYKQNSFIVEAGIRAVSMFNKKDSLIYGGHVGQHAKTPSIDYAWNTLQFEYSSTLYGHQENIVYSYLLEGFDKTWSEWTKKTAKEYTNLPAGTYTFKVKARTNLGNESAPADFTFTVLPPWHQTPIAFAIYFLLALGLLYIAYSYQKRKLELQRIRHIEEQKKLQYLHQLEIDKNEKQIVQLNNEKLEAEVNHKNKDLATVAMHLVQKGELLTKIKEELIKIQNRHQEDKPHDSFKKLIKIINEEEKKDDDWEQFSVHFDKVHSNFLTLLKERFPNLSPNELKLSAYLRMNLSSKEIAQLMNISVRGVEISRYRLRKKLSIPTEVNLFNFLMDVNTASKNNSAAAKHHKELKPVLLTIEEELN